MLNFWMFASLLGLFSGVTAFDDPSPDDPTPEAWLDKAAVFQRGETPLGELPSSFHGRFWVTAQKPQGGTVSLEVERHWTRSPERLLTRRRDTVLESDTSVGFDGEGAWFVNNKNGETVVYSEDPEAFEADIALVQEDLRLTALLLEASLVDALRPRLRELRVLEGGQPKVLEDLDKRRRAVVVLGAITEDRFFGPDPDAPPPSRGATAPRVRVELAIDRETGAIRRVRLVTLDREQPRAVELQLLLHAPTVDGLTMPASLILIEDGREVLNMGVTPDEDGLLVYRIDPEIEAALFELPE